MNQETPQPQKASNSALDYFGKVIGFIVALLTVQPIYHQSYFLFKANFLRYTDYQYYWCWELVWGLAIFLLIGISVWLLITSVISKVTSFICQFIRGFFITIAALLMSLRR